MKPESRYVLKITLLWGLLTAAVCVAAGFVWGEIAGVRTPPRTDPDDLTLPNLTWMLPIIFSPIAGLAAAILGGVHARRHPTLPRPSKVTPPPSDSSA